MISALCPPVADVLEDDRGRLWMAAHDPGSRPRGEVGSGWDVIDAGEAQVTAISSKPTGNRTWTAGLTAA